MFKRLSIGLLALIATVLTSRVSCADNVLWVGSWNVKAVDTKYVDLLQYGEVHVSDHAPAPLQYQLSARAAFDPWKSLGFMLGYSYLSRQVLSDAPEGWDDVVTHRFEAEIDPRWNLGNDVKLIVRNRFEERWIEGKPGTYPRSRHRLELDVPLKKAGPVSEMFTYVEPFVDWRTGEISQARVAPLGLTFKFSSHLSLRTFYAWQTTQSPSGWFNDHMFWTQWLIDLK
jgi:hypothetical protein